MSLGDLRAGPIFEGDWVGERMPRCVARSPLSSNQICVEFSLSGQVPLFASPFSHYWDKELKQKDLLRSLPILQFCESHVPEKLRVLISIHGSLFSKEPGNLVSNYPLPWFITYHQCVVASNAVAALSPPRG